MSLKYASTRQLHYGSPSRVDRVIAKIPAGAQPISTAPSASASPVIVYGADGVGHWALYHRNSWQKLRPFKDDKYGSVSWRMDGDQVEQPIAWALPRQR